MILALVVQSTFIALFLSHGAVSFELCLFFFLVKSLFSSGLFCLNFPLPPHCILSVIKIKVNYVFGLFRSAFQFRREEFLICGGVSDQKAAKT